MLVLRGHSLGRGFLPDTGVSGRRRVLAGIICRMLMQTVSLTFAAAAPLLACQLGDHVTRHFEEMGAQSWQVKHEKLLEDERYSALRLDELIEESARNIDMRLL